MQHEIRLIGKYTTFFVFPVILRHFMGLSSSKMSANKHVVVNATEKQTASVIFFHGLGDTGHGWAAGFDEIKAPYIKYIFPNAPTQPVTLNAGMAMPSWFDIRSLSFDGPEDTDGIIKSSNLMLSVVEEEVKNGIPLDRIVIGGFSQGGAVALHAAITSGKQFGGLLGLSTWLPLYKEMMKVTTTPQLRILQCHGNGDPVVNYKFGQMTAEFLSSKLKCPNHEFKTYSGMGHSSSSQEMEDVKQFLAKVLPPV